MSDSSTSECSDLPFFSYTRRPNVLRKLCELMTGAQPLNMRFSVRLMVTVANT
jgi:hypothetical protein